MEAEDKDLLLKELCGRLPYETMCATTDNDGSLPNIWEIVKADMINEDFFLIHDSYEASRRVDVKEVRPYLLPLLRMTKEQKKFFDDKNIKLDGWEIVSKEGSHYQSSCYTDIEDWLEVIDWLNKNHFDYRGLINKGLAIDATGLDIY